MGDIEYFGRTSEDVNAVCTGFKIRGQTFSKDQQLYFQLGGMEGSIQCFAEIREVLANGTVNLRIYFLPGNTPIGMARPTLFGEVCSV